MCGSLEPNLFNPRFAGILADQRHCTVNFAGKRWGKADSFRDRSTPRFTGARCRKCASPPRVIRRSAAKAVCSQSRGRIFADGVPIFPVRGINSFSPAQRMVDAWDRIMRFFAGTASSWWALELKGLVYQRSIERPARIAR
jgi:hypothetical protein